MASTRLVSKQDLSVNFVADTADGIVEARFVRRRDDYFIAYVSSQTGCNKGCRFCHLTQSGQTRGADLDVASIVAQAEQVLGYYDDQVGEGRQAPAAKVHFNFMARGEPFANRHLRTEGDRVCTDLARRGVAHGLSSQVKISTIFPRELADTALVDIFVEARPDIYYSLYSVNPSFRRRWLPRALPADVALQALKEWQLATDLTPMLHWALIAGENDSPADLDAICQAVTDAELRCDINLVRYNPFSERHGFEPSIETIDRVAAQLLDGLPGTTVRIVTRVGMDVAASCGMFVDGGSGQPVVVSGRKAKS